MSQRTVTWGLLALGNVLVAGAAQAEGVSFATRRDSPGGGYPISIAVGDFNRDGIPDLAVANGGIQVLFGNGDGTFLAGHSFAAGAGANSIVASDFNGDGILDLAVASLSAGRVSVLLGNGDGTFEA